MTTNQSTTERTGTRNESRRVSRASLLLMLGVLVVLAAYVVSLIGLQHALTDGDGVTSFSGQAVAYGVLGMFSSLCAFVLAFVAAAMSTND